MRKLLRKILPLKFKLHIYAFLEWLYLPIILFFNERSDNTDSVALVRCYDAVGDFVIWLSTAKEVRSMYPNKKIILICVPAVKPLAEQYDCFDEIVAVKTDLFEPIQMYNIYKKLSKMQAQTMIQFVPKRTLAEDFVSAAISAHYKVTVANQNLFHPNCWMRKQLEKIYDVIVPVNYHFMHQIQIDALVLHYLGHHYITKIDVIPPMYFDTKILTHASYFIVSPGANDMSRCWDTNKFAQIVSYIFKKYGLVCCLCGSSNEREMADRIIQLCEGVKIIDLVGHTDLLRLIEVVRGSKFVVCNDTGIIHIAVATATYSICIYGPWETGSFLPYNANDVSNIRQPLLCCHNDMDCALCDMEYTKDCLGCQQEHGQRLCIYNVTVEEVKEKVDQLIMENNIEGVSRTD